MLLEILSARAGERNEEFSHRNKQLYEAIEHEVQRCAGVPSIHDLGGCTLQLESSTLHQRRGIASDVRNCLNW